MIIVLWLFALFAAFVFAVNYHLVFVPSLAACAITVAADVPFISILIIVAPEIISFGLFIFVFVYLRYKIIKSKPTLSVLITGGIDGSIGFDGDCYRCSYE